MDFQYYLDFQCHFQCFKKFHSLKHILFFFWKLDEIDYQAIPISVLTNIV